MRAANMYEPSHGKFISYAVWWIRQAIMAYLHDHSHTIRIPNPTALKDKVKRAEAYARKRGPRAKHALTPNEARAEVDAVMRLRELHSTEAMLELGLEPADPQQDPSAGVDAWDVRRTAHRLLAALPPRDREVLRAYYGMDSGEGMTLDEVGVRFDLTRERVRQIKEGAISRMRPKLLKAQRV